MATFKITIDKRHKVENDKYHLTLRVSNKQEVLYLRLGAQMTVKEYEKHFVKKSYDKEVDKIRSKFNKCVDRAKKILPSIDPFDSTKFREKYFDTSFDPDNIITEEQKKRGTINYLFQNYIKVKTESKEIGLSSVNLLNGTLNNIKKFRTGLSYEDITPEFLHAFEHWYINKNLPEGKRNSLASFGGLCRNIKAVINYHRKKKIIPVTYEYPFDDYKIPNFVPPKKVISNAEIQKILDCTEFENVMEEYARDIWEMLYRLNGINFIDLLKLRWDNIEGNRFVFYRHKTLKTRRNNIRPIEVVINSKVQKLLDKIGDKKSLYVIGQIKQVNYTDQYLLERNHKLKREI